MSKYYDTAPHVIAASVALPVVDIIAVALKFRTRQFQKQPLKADDWLLVPATVSKSILQRKSCTFYRLFGNWLI